MPIYEFYCPDCHAIYNFLSRSINTSKKPACPRCKREGLDRLVSKFAVVGRAVERKESPVDDLPIDEAKMEKALMSMASEIEGVDENDPKQAARLMKKFCDTTGMQFGPSMEEALHRMESGEDPESIEEELGDLIEQEDPFQSKEPLEKWTEKVVPRRALPRRDETLYEL